VIKEDKWFVENGGGGWKLLQGDNVGPNVALRGREFDLVQLLDSEIGRRGVSGFDTAGLLDRYAGGPPNCADLFYLKVELRDGDHKPLMSFDSTVLTAVPEWRLVSSTLFGFGPGVRYLYWEDGAKDVENWAGHFGTKIAGAFLEFKWHPNDQLARLGIRESIASYLPEREAPCALPFYTNFDQGVGHRLFSAGELVREGEWSHLSRQSLQPTYRYGQRCGDCIEFGIGHDLAFEGGSCLLVSGQFDSRVPAPGEAPYQLARLFKTCLALPTGDRSALLLVSITHRPETPNATVELVLELDDASLVRLATPTRSPARPLLEGKTAGEVLVIEAAHVDRLHGWDRAAYRVPADVLGGRRVVGLALLSQDLTREPSRASTGLTAFKARVGEIRINSAQPTQDENQPTSTAAASWWFPRPPPVCRLQGRTSWTIASLHPHLASSANLAQEEESGGAKEVRLANVWLTWERPTAADRAQEVESCDVYFAGKFLGRSYANGYFAENVLYEAPTRADDSEGERMADAARVVVKW
ncbi:Mannosyl-glycoprotein endo-beta-N-acetylglucosamidase, partial [Acanthamoeba castellanii str. Neff]